jgi:hypothetical protein
MNRSLKSIGALALLLLLSAASAGAASFSWQGCTLSAFTNAVRVENCNHHNIDNGDEQIHMYMLDRSVVSIAADRGGHIASMAIVADYTGNEIDRWLCQNLIRETIGFLFPEWNVASAVELYTETLPSLLACAAGAPIKTHFGNRAITLTPSEHEGGHVILSVTERPVM